MRRLIALFGIVLIFGLWGCEDETTRYIEVDREPSIPQGVYSITGDNEVIIFWLHVQDDDLSHYNVYWSPDDDLYEYMGSTEDTFYVDTDVDNGTTYYYAVTSVDQAGNESALSHETVFDTPRPEDDGLFIFTLNNNPGNSGYDFSDSNIVAWNDIMADIYLDYDSSAGAMFINVANINTDIQDMGYTYDFDEIGYSPEFGWSDVGWVELIQNHTYIVWTADNHFAKIRPTSLAGDFGAQFQWAYQIATGNPELARPQHDENYLSRTKTGTLLK
jgi:hypothetical protein